MKLSFLFFIMMLFVASTARSQVGINTDNPDPSAALDIVSTNQGVLIPRMSALDKSKIVNPAPGLLVYDTDSKCISVNTGTTVNPSWLCLSNDTYSSSFYMPAIDIDATALVQNKEIDLYAAYSTQFNTPVKSSDGSPASIPYFTDAKSLYYYITYYDNTVIKINSLSESGVLNYDIIKVLPKVNETFMNVVFVVK